MSTATVRAGSRGMIAMERDYNAPIADVWEMWTTQAGIESWWGPEGFRVEVQKLDLRPGGELLYTMIASEPETIAFMKQAGMPTATAARIVFSDVTPPRLLRYVHAADFIPGVTPYDVLTEVLLEESKTGTHLTLRFEAMHDAVWSERQEQGWQSELGKLDRALSARSGRT